MKTIMTRRTPRKTRIRNFFGHRPILQVFCNHNSTEYKQVATRPRRTMHGTPRYGDNVIADIVDGSVVRSYVTPMLDQNVSMTVNDGVDNPVYYYNQDERQSVMNLTDSTGVVVQDYAYSAYGDKLRSQVSSLIPNRYTYTGRELSDTTGDFYFRYRNYSANTGSFMSRDPLGYIDGTSVYAGYFSRLLSSDAYGLEKCSSSYNFEDYGEEEANTWDKFELVTWVIFLYPGNAPTKSNRVIYETEKSYGFTVSHLVIVGYKCCCNDNGNYSPYYTLSGGTQSYLLKSDHDAWGLNDPPDGLTEEEKKKWKKAWVNRTRRKIVSKREKKAREKAIKEFSSMQESLEKSSNNAYTTKKACEKNAKALLELELRVFALGINVDPDMYDSSTATVGAGYE